ncbi:MAG: DnaJ domain-containing protein [Deltaproteobacteria bacterium]
MPKDYYLVLGVSRGADLNKIKKAYRTVVKKLHPDISSTKESEEKFLEVREAYETLCDERKREQYDEELSGEGSRLRITKVPDIVERRRSCFDDMDRAFSRVDDFFEGSLPGFFDRGRGREDKELYFEMILSPIEAAQGGLFPITVPVVEPCPRCGKTGYWESFFCPACLGYGRIRTNRTFSLSIPPNVRHGEEIRLSMEDIGLKDAHLHIQVLIDPYLDEEVW